jgi:hypothetical protein
MPLADLSEEVLAEIVRNTSAISRFDAQLREIRKPRPDALLWCGDWGLEALSSVNKDLRRICFPTLFSEIILGYRRVSEGRKALRLLNKLLSARAHVASQIRSVTLFLSA